jgi:hypothetical protein
MSKRKKCIYWGKKSSLRLFTNDTFLGRHTHENWILKIWSDYRSSNSTEWKSQNLSILVILKIENLTTKEGFLLFVGVRFYCSNLHLKSWSTQRVKNYLWTNCVSQFMIECYNHSIWVAKIIIVFFSPKNIIFSSFTLIDSQLLRAQIVALRILKFFEPVYFNLTLNKLKFN